MCLVESTSTQREPQEINLTETNSANSTSTNKCLSSNAPQTDSQSEIQQVNNQTLNRETPKQTELKAEIAKIESKITSLTALKEYGFATTENVNHLKEARNQLKEKNQKLKTLISDAQRQRKRRAEKKKIISELSNQSTSNASKLKKFTHTSPGRPPLEDTYPDLHQAIVALVTAGAGADFRRRTDVLNACKSLDELHAGFLAEGYILSCQAAYLRVIPKRSDSHEGKCHVHTVPVKIRRAQNNLRNKHEDANFCFATKQYMKDIVSLFGEKNVFVLSVPIPIGVTTANKEMPLIMHVDYEIRLPDHDFVKATKHKLTPSVYAACEIRSTSSKTAPEISYSGPTYIAIRSGKHDSSTAYSHGRDFDYALVLEEFQSVVKNDGEIKPVAMIFSDGGPDENPCFPKTLDVAVQHFKKHNFDALLISMHAPSLSAYNQVERRMAPLSKALTGLLLPHNTFGNHLDSQRRTIDVVRWPISVTAK